MRFCIESAAKKKSGVYLIKSLVDGSGYVGSARNLFSRFSTHRAEMRQGKAINRRVQIKLAKYGIDNFEFHLLEVVSPSELPDREQFYVDAFEGECLNTQFKISTFRKLLGKRTARISLKVTPENKKIWEQAALKRNISINTLIETTVLRKLDEADFKQRAEAKAEEEKRSLSSYIEMVVEKDIASGSQDAVAFASGTNPLHDLDKVPEIKAPSQDDWLNS